MTKKYKKQQFSKPSSTAHPSLLPSSTPSQHVTNPIISSDSSVNELIQHLRRSQGPSAADRIRDDSNTPTVHPSLKAILQVPDTLPPPPRPGMRRAEGRRIRGPSGPPAPNSWLESSIHSPTRGRIVKPPSKKPTAQTTLPKRLDRLPGLYLPNENTLLHLTLKALAKSWSYHLDYDQYYLAAVPMRYKEALLSYIAVYGDRKADRTSLETLFLDESELEGATGSETLTHLDLTGSDVSTLNIYLAKYLPPQISKEAVLSKNTYGHVLRSASSNIECIPDSWDASSSSDASTISPTPFARFPALTHLSLSHPSNPSWSDLLKLSPHLATLTHLSLAYWPTPSLTPNSKTCITTSPTGPINYGGSNFYSEFDDDWSEATGILRRLSKNTCCLKWLDLEGCSGWVQALSWKRETNADESGSDKGVDWNRCWRAVGIVRVGQGWKPKSMEAEEGDWRERLQSAKERLIWQGEMGTITSATTATTTPNSAVMEGNGRRQQNFELARWFDMERVISAMEAEVMTYRRRAGGRALVFERGFV